MAACVPPPCGGMILSPEVPETGTDTIVHGEAGARVHEFLRRQGGFGYSGSILVVRRDTVLLRAAYGYADAARRIAYRPATAFDIGSLAKQFTAAAVLRLEMDGRLSTSDSIARHLSGVPDDKRGITIHHLLTHSSGLPGDFPYGSPEAAGAEYEVVGRDTAVRRILEMPLESPPGSGFSYSNPGYVLLAAIVERAGGRPFRDYVREALWTPAGMAHTGFWGAAPNLPDSLVARGHDELGRVVHDPVTRSADTWFDLGGGEVVSTLDDLRRWMEALLANRILSPEATEKLFHPWVEASAPYPPTVAHGYGWNLGPAGPGGPASVHHGGDYLGTGVQLYWFGGDRTLVITSTNVRHDLYPTRNRTDRIIPRILAGEAYTLPPDFAALDAPDPDVEGRYELPTGGRLVVRAEGGRTYLGAEGQDAVDLLERAPTDSVRALRAELTRRAGPMLRGAWVGDTVPVRGHAGPVVGTAGLTESLREWLRELGSGKGDLTGVDVHGTYATGFPSRGSREKTAVVLRYQDGTVPMLIHWVERRLAAASDTSPRATMAARMPIQRVAPDRYAGWDIVDTTAVELAFTRSGGRVSGVRVRRDTVEAEARRLAP